MNTPSERIDLTLRQDLETVRDAVSFARSKLNGYTLLGLDITYALDRIEAALEAAAVEREAVSNVQRWLNVAGPGTEVRVSRALGGGSFIVVVEECDGAVPVEFLEGSTLELALRGLVALARKELAK